MFKATIWANPSMFPWDVSRTSRSDEILFSHYEPRNPKILAVDAPDELWLVRDVISGLSWSSLSVLASCVAQQVGFGTPMVSFAYDDEPMDAHRRPRGPTRHIERRAMSPERHLGRVRR